MNGEQKKEDKNLSLLRARQSDHSPAEGQSKGGHRGNLYQGTSIGGERDGPREDNGIGALNDRGDEKKDPHCEVHQKAGR